MPQMAPILWFWFFFIMMCALLALISILFFQLSDTTSLELSSSTSFKPNSWLW